MTANVEPKASAIAEIIEGSVVDDSQRVAVCIKGAVAGFPATLEAINPGWPFGVMYTIETHVATDPVNMPDPSRDSKIVICPRVGRGLMSIITKLLLFESSGRPVGDRKLENVFNFSYDERDVAERFAHYPGIADQLYFLEENAKFSEIVIRTQVGIYLAQPTSFNSLDLDVCRATFKSLGEIGRVLYEAF